MPVEKDLTLFLKTLPKLPTNGQVALIQSMALRKEQAAREYVVTLLKSKDKDVRTVVLNALGDIGNADDAMMLVTTAANTKDEGSEIARYSLARLEDKKVNKVLADGLEKAKAKIRVEIITSLGYRNATEAAGNILPYISDPDDAVRMASLLAMERLGNENHVTPIINFIKQTQNEKEKQAADKVLHSIVATVGEKSMSQIQTAYASADNTLRLQLMSLLHLVGADDALQLVRSAIKAENTEMKDIAIRTLANWTNEKAMTDLREITQNTEMQQNHRVLAFRGYIRLIRNQENPRRPKSSTLRRAMSMAERVEEKKLVLAAFGDLSDMSALKCVERYMYDEEIAEEACAAVISIARKVGQQNKTDTGLAMIQVLNRTKSPRVKRDANRLLTSLGIDQQKLLGTGPTGTPTKKLIFLSGPMDHAPFPGAHDYIRDLVLLKRQLETASNIEPLDIKLYIGTKPDIAELKDADLLVVHSSADRLLGEVHALFPSFHEEYTEEYQTYLKEVDNLVKQGLGVMVLHYSLWTDKPQSRKYMLDWVGGYHDDETADVKLAEFDVTFPTPSHAVMNGVKPWSGREEYYFRQNLPQNDKRRIPLIACTLNEETQNDVIGWGIQRNKGRGFGFTGCHGHWMLLNQDYNRFVMNAIIWTAGIKVPKAGVDSKIPDDWDLVQQPN
jgi:HEAT repeat protein/type 1 glutamine amidotransferase